jgi:hypothetical protein
MTRFAASSGNDSNEKDRGALPTVAPSHGGTLKMSASTWRRSCSPSASGPIVMSADVVVCAVMIGVVRFRPLSADVGRLRPRGEHLRQDYDMAQ